MNDAIARAYYRRIKNGVITIEDVPEPKREVVQEMLDADSKDRGDE